jgi:hypothetical protein
MLMPELSMDLSAVQELVWAESSLPSWMGQHVALLFCGCGRVQLVTKENICIGLLSCRAELPRFYMMSVQEQYMRRLLGQLKTAVESTTQLQSTAVCHCQ